MNIAGMITHKSFDKDYSKLTKEIKQAFKERRNLFLIDPAHPLLHDHALQGKWEGHRSINVTGDFRALYYLSNNIAVFVAIGTHPYLYG